MRPHQLIYLADALRNHREHHDARIMELARRATPLTPQEAEALIEASNAHLLDVENALRHSAYLRSRRSAKIVRWARRVRSWTRPRIGILKHYEPKPVIVPARYLDVVPPYPAPTISIVTPSYQQGRFIDRTLYSVVSQEYPALEYVVQDGGSTDETIAVLRRFEPRLSSWASERDGGQADAINRGFARTSGEIMAWLNSDDLLLPGALAYVARYFAEHPEVDVVYGQRIMVDDGDAQIGAWILPRHDDRALTLADYVPQETLFWRRRIWEAAGGSVDPSFTFALDWDLLLRFRAAGATMVRLPRFLGAFRVHPEQKTTVDDAIGQRECDRLRERIHGRPLTIAEVLAGLRPYLARHIVVHDWQRFVDRLPLRRIRVDFAPREPELRRPAAEAIERRPALGAAVTSPLTPSSWGVPQTLAQLDGREDLAPSRVPATREEVGG